MKILLPVPRGKTLCFLKLGTIFQKIFSNVLTVSQCKMCTARTILFSSASDGKRYYAIVNLKILYLLFIMGPKCFQKTIGLVSYFQVWCYYQCLAAKRIEHFTKQYHENSKKIFPTYCEALSGTGSLKFSSDCGQLRQYSGRDLSELEGFNQDILKYCIEIEPGGLQQD